MPKAQASIELISIMVIALLVTIVFLSMAAKFLSDINIQASQAKARDSVILLAQAADFVYAQGDRASVSVKIDLPTTTNFSPSATFIGKPPGASASTPSTQLNIRVDGSDAYAVTRAAVLGSFPSSPGTFSMKVLSHGSYVTISQDLIDFDKRAIYFTMGQNETRTALLTVYRTAGEEVDVNCSYRWGFADPSLSASPLDFQAAYNGTSVTISISTGANSSGTYSSQLYINARGARSNSTESIDVPVSVDVRS